MPKIEKLYINKNTFAKEFIIDDTILDKKGLKEEVQKYLTLGGPQKKKVTGPIPKAKEAEEVQNYLNLLELRPIDKAEPVPKAKVLMKSSYINSNVTWYNKHLGYGFIYAGRTPIFFHWSTVSNKDFSKKSRIKSGTPVEVEYNKHVVKGVLKSTAIKVTIK
jgi:cold shock CspA family protein